MYYPGGSQSARVQFYTSQLAAEPTHVSHYQGLTAQQVHNRNIHRAQNHGRSYPQLVPQTRSPDAEILCRELDGSWTLRTVNTIMNSLQPGHWVQNPEGSIQWIRQAKA